MRHPLRYLAALIVCASAAAAVLFAPLPFSTSRTGPSVADRVVSHAIPGVHIDPTWPISSPLSPLPTAPFGQPTCALDDAKHCTVRHYHGFDLDYDDRILAPRWTAYKLTAAVVRTHKEIKREPKFWGDAAIENAGYRITAQMDYNNRKGVHEWDRGHMVPFNDARCWGDEAAHDCFVTANIVPQNAILNEQAWELLEQRVDAHAKLKSTIYVFTGPIYDKPLQAFAPGRAVPAPDRLYKVVVWREVDDRAGVAAWIMPNGPLDKKTDLDKYLVLLGEVERAASIRFLPRR